MTLRSIVFSGLLAALLGCSASADSAPPDATSDDALTAAPAIVDDPHGHATRYPIVLVHGFNASPTAPWGSFYRVPEVLRADGHVVFVPSLPPYDSTTVRARSLAAQLDDALRESGADKVNVIAHSMGGLDTRELISTLGYGDRIASLTTISTPHRGSAIADVILSATPVEADRAVNAFARAFGDFFSTQNQSPNVRAVLTSLAESTAPTFNAAHPDDPRVYYQSWAGVSNVGGIVNPADAVACEDHIMTYRGRPHVMEALLTASAGFVSHGVDLRPNDGLVMVESAKWGQFRGCVPASHLSELGQIALPGADRRTGFDHVRFYRNVAYELAEKGF